MLARDLAGYPTPSLHVDAAVVRRAPHLVAERVWQEFGRGLLEEHPERMFDALERCDFVLLPHEQDDPWVRGKSHNRLVAAIAAGNPVASAR